jgi:hypothetical protein
MGLFNLPQTFGVSADARQEIVARYQRLRPIHFQLNHALTGLLSKNKIHEGARRLGMLRRDVIYFDNEDETSVLMDYCIYDVYRNGRNAVEQYLCDSPPDHDSDEMDCLRAMQHASYSLVAVLHVEPGVGCQVRNLFTDETRLLVDMGFSRSAVPGAVMATRLLDFGDYIATGGAALPIGVLNDKQLEEWMQRISAGVHEEDFDPAPLIRMCLEQGASSYIRYEEADSPSRSRPQRKYSLAGSQAKRRGEPKEKRPLATRRCRCGSGKMYKNCCGKQRGTP